ncbi:MAG: hypothetical protein KC464_24800, partial [Myxococcales bacterium]|nr:hypothetical protein [Myxococcales bacterium]
MRRSKTSFLGNTVRVALVAAAAVAAAASAGSTNNKPAATSTASTPPPPQAMDPQLAMGLWQSSFGAVKIEADPQLQGSVQGVWVYDRGGGQVIGLFLGPLKGNVLEFQWQEPSDAGELSGAGYLVFDPYGQRFSGKWWTGSRDRTGEWTGWRQQPDDGGAATGPA